MSKEKPPEQDEAALFREMMSGVKPLSREKRIEHQAKKPPPRPREPDIESRSGSEFIERDFIEPVAAEEQLFFTRPSLQHRLKQRLKRGEIPIDARIDLHGQTIAVAGDNLAAFIDEARQHNCRCVLVVHGKGQRSAQGEPILKSQVNHWLRQSDKVLGFCTARPKDGGSGAMYVLLRRIR